MFPVSKAAVLKALCIPLCPLAPRRSVVALRSQSAYQSTTAVSSPIEASSAGRPLTWTQQYSRPLSAFLLFTSLAFLTLENIRLQLEHNVMEEDQLAEIAGLTTKRQKLREQLILAQQQQPNP
ncbi:hypothetical protein BASA50_009571 [Batrachochytrium salamandrivorans]|uniref:Uncharacterized protein n=1 Tax=Batrachochytrium salamandrivorans TaxID=1357716 RepID=A0ABQ8F0X9_9FUNG|nr:hypothetical protein BASA62_007898 [Batrachochytrium salamandrivorans]KAH6583338.1 hypothetical protein BASA61_008048 [Batrachochytrium salamandrivorans]KAH6583692.1 hypothetical protein BASA60_001337 [Batrachochytrium salamandrivorans]KAH6590158.1 hypothetical protein BASA50_009571 [Batrachochytrium salamandrivorans]KAH9257397.1 hypothetical protein BASA81_004556 [Batrachochytrium salamandrivorans]